MEHNNGFEVNVDNLFANKDDSLDIDSLLEEAKEEAKKANEEIKKDDEVSDAKITHKKETISPLQEMKNYREQSNYSEGMILGNQELEEGKIQSVKTDVFLRKERLEEFENYEDEMDEIIKKNNYIEIINKPTDKLEFANMMMEIDAVKVGIDGVPYIDFRDTEGNSITPKYIKIKANDSTVVAKNKDNDDDDKSNVIIENNENNLYDSVTPEKRELSEDEQKSIQIIIDKTGLGADVVFSEEEKKKIREAEVIELTEVKRIDINAIKDKVSKRSFQDIANSFDYSGSRSTIFFPASGFKAQMKGLTYGEFADIALSMENLNEDKYRKQLSIIYNKMTNISIGEFSSFDEFLKNFCFLDVNLATYAMYIATEDENQEIQLKCGNTRCNKSFNWSFNTRSIIRMDRCSKNFIKKMEELVTADASQYEEIHQRSVVLNSHYIELPKSKFIVEIGLASAYEYLHNIVPILDEKKFKEVFGDDFNEMHLNISVLLTTVRSIRIPEKDGSYVLCDTYRNIIDAIYSISPEEIAILNSYSMKFQQAYEMSFGFDNVVCPHCKTKTKFIPLQPTELIFTTYQRLANTELDLKTSLDF